MPKPAMGEQTFRISPRRLISEEFLLLLLAGMAALACLLLFDAGTRLLTASLVILAGAVALLGGVYLPLLWRAAGCRIAEKALLVSGGVFFHKRSMIPLTQIVNAVFVQTPVTPILKTGTVVVLAAGASVTIRGLDVADARRLVRQISPQTQL